MDLIGVLGLASSVLGLSKEAVNFIKSQLSAKVLITPNEIETYSKHWDSTNSIYVQNLTNRPLFSIQIVIWPESNQTVEFKFEDISKETELENLVINYGVVLFSGLVDDQKVIIAEILRLKPNETIEIDLQIQRKGKIKVFPVAYDEKQSKQVLNKDSQFAYPFSPPFEMKLTSISLNLRKTA